MPHSKHKDHSHRHAEHGGRPRKYHKDWRLWLAVVLMLLGMVIYVVTLDESRPLGESDSKQPVPVIMPDAN